MVNHEKPTNSCDSSVVILNPMASDHPTGMGVASQSLQECFPEYQCAKADRIYRFINDRIRWGWARMAFRAVAAEYFAWRYRRQVVIFTTHQGPLICCGRTWVVLYDFICLRHPFQNRLQAVSYLWLLPRILRRAAKVIVISHSVARELRAHLPEFQAREIPVIPCLSSRVERFQPGRVPVEERIRNGHFLFVGAQYAHKRLDAAVTAVLALQNRGHPVQLTVVGANLPLWTRILRAESSTLAKQGIDLRAYVTTQELEDLYDRTSALLYLSETEGFGLPPVEAMKKGCPVICNDLEVLRETCGEAAFYVNHQNPDGLVGLLSSMLSGSMISEIKQKQALGFMQAEKYSYARLRSRWQEELTRFISLA